jgi:hypothetical protein
MLLIFLVFCVVCVLLCFGLSSFCVLYLMLPVCLDGPFLIAPSVFSITYLVIVV